MTQPCAAIITTARATGALPDPTPQPNPSALAKYGARSLADFSELQIDEGQTLLGRRYLCRGGAFLFVGPSGIGKSSAAVQQDTCWSCGKAAFGIQPACDLRILTAQAENDDGDLHEMARGVFGGLELSPDDIEHVRRNTRYVRLIATGDEFLFQLHSLIEEFKPDLVRLDPLSAFLGADPKDTKSLAEFCRVGLDRLTAKFNCGLIVNHHTPKTNFRNTDKWTAHDWMYAGAGAADLTNWARAVLVIEPIDAAAGVFKFIAAKRGGRIGWRQIGDSVGQPEIERFFRHAKEPGIIHWTEATTNEIQKAQTTTTKTKTADDLLALVPDLEKVEKNTLISRASKNGIGDERARRFIEELRNAGKLHEHREKRKGTNAKKLLARFPQAEEPKP